MEFNRTYPLVNIQKTMENPPMFNGTIHYFYGHFQQQTVKLPEGTFRKRDLTIV